MALVFCRECGKQISDQAIVCPSCGAPGKPVYHGEPKSKSTATLLAILLGGVGAHKFYLGRTGMGLVYLLFCWTFIPAIIGFLEGIVYASTKEQEFQEKYVLTA